MCAMNLHTRLNIVQRKWDNIVQIKWDYKKDGFGHLEGIVSYNIDRKIWTEKQNFPVQYQRRVAHIKQWVKKTPQEITFKATHDCFPYF